jgi:hypothetical protein
MPMMQAAKAPAAATSRRAPIGMLGIFRAPYAAMHPAANAGGTHGGGARSRHMRAAAFAAVCIVVATLCWAYAAVQPASIQRLAAAAPAGRQQEDTPPDWLATGGNRKDSERSLRADGVGTGGSGAAGGAAAAPLHPELAGVLGDWRQRAAAIRRMRRWEHGLGAHQVPEWSVPTPPYRLLSMCTSVLVLPEPGDQVVHSRGSSAGLGSMWSVPMGCAEWDARGVRPCCLQPLPPKAILEAAAALFAAGGRLQGLNAATGIGTDASSALGPAALGLRSYYAPWILADLAHWSHSGISQVLGGTLSSLSTHKRPTKPQAPH